MGGKERVNDDYTFFDPKYHNEKNLQEGRLGRKSRIQCLFNVGYVFFSTTWFIIHSTYHCVTIAYSIQYSNMVHRRGAEEQ